MTNNGGDRLDQITALLQQSIVASDERMTRLEQRLEQSAAASDERMTRLEQRIEQSITASDERMTRLEQRIEQERAESNERLTRIEQLTESTSRSLQSLSDDITTFRLTTEQNIENAQSEREELRRVTLGIANLLGSLDEDRPTILGRLSRIENKVDRLLERGQQGDTNP